MSDYLQRKPLSDVKNISNNGHSSEEREIMKNNNGHPSEEGENVTRYSTSASKDTGKIIMIQMKFASSTPTYYLLSIYLQKFLIG